MSQLHATLQHSNTVKTQKTVNLPSHHNEEIQAVPGVSKVTLLAKDPKGHHLQHHLHGKEDEDEIIKYLKEPQEKRRLSLTSACCPFGLQFKVCK